MLLGGASHQIQNRVDDAPGQVASQRADEHHAHVVAPRLGDAERAGVRQHHYQPEQHFRRAIDRIERVLGGLHGTIGMDDLACSMTAQARPGGLSFGWSCGWQGLVALDCRARVEEHPIAAEPLGEPARRTTSSAPGLSPASQITVPRSVSRRSPSMITCSAEYSMSGTRLMSTASTRGLSSRPARVIRSATYGAFTK